MRLFSSNTDKNLLKLTFLMLFLFGIFPVVAQENPPVPIKVEVRNAQGLNFGSFVVGPSGGTISIEPSGEKVPSTDIFPLDFGTQEHYAIFDVYANPGTIVQIQQPPNLQLSGPSGSNVILSINPSTQTSTGSSFIVTQNPQPVFVGGTLTLTPGAAPPGQYNGTFTLTFIHQ